MPENTPQYDPKLPDAEVLKRRKKSQENQDIEHEEAAGTTTGEEMRPKDGTLDGGSAR